MTKICHSIFIGFMIITVFATLIIISIEAYEYYFARLNERFYHELHDKFKPSGVYGHGFGIIGSLLMFIGVASYMLRKRLRSMAKIGQIKYWLEFHIFLCTLGPILIFFHTAMKFGGIVSISFWSMIAVFISGILGRFIYIQIPRTIEGRELSLHELESSKNDLASLLIKDIQFNETSLNLIINSTKSRTEIIEKSSIIRFIKKHQIDRRNIKTISKDMKKYSLTKSQRNQILKNVRNEIVLNRRIDRLNFMKSLFNYWHVAHLPFAIIMLVIMIIHIVVTLLFGYKWIF